MKIIVTAGTCCLLMFICFGFTFPGEEVEYQVIPVQKVEIDQKFRPAKTTIGTFLYTDPKQLKDAFSGMTATDITPFDFENNRFVHIQYAEQAGCKEAIEVIQEVRKYKHYYEVILIPYNQGNCKNKVKPYQVTALPNDRLPVLITGTLPE